MALPGKAVGIDSFGRHLLRDQSANPAAERAAALKPRQQRIDLLQYCRIHVGIAAWYRVPQMPAVERQPGNTAIKPHRATEKLFVLVGVHRRRMGDLYPFRPDARMNEVAGAGDGRSQGPVHILPAVMFGHVRLPAENGLVGGLFEA